MRVVTVYAPRGEDPFGETIFTRTPDVIHDLPSAIFHDRFANACGDIVKRCIPGSLFPFALTAFAGALEWIKNAIGILNLVERCRTLRTVAPARPGMLGVTFKLLNFAGDLVDVGEQTASRFTVEARSWN